MSTGEYNLPLHVTPENGDGGDYVIDDAYDTSPGMGWDGQGDGGGKFRLKRRRRCGQCGPCQVKENCNKCQYCMRKDVLKQACIYRKCVFLRKPVPRFRQDPPSNGTTAGSGTTGNKQTPTPPRKSQPPANATITNGPSNHSNGPTPAAGSASTPIPSNGAVSSPPVNGAPPPAVIPPPPAQPTSMEMSSCRLNQSPFAALSAMQSMNNGVLDPLRHRMMEQAHRPSLFDSMNPHHTQLDPGKTGLTDSASRFPGSASLPTGGVNSSHCKLDHQTTPGVNPSSDMNSTSSALNSMNSAALSSRHPHQMTANKMSALPGRDPYFSAMESWPSMPYTLPHAPSWASPAALPAPTIPTPHHYSFQQHSSAFPSSFTPSSCRLGGLPDSTGRYPSAHQASFHHSMTGMAGFSQDLAAASNHAAAAAAANHNHMCPSAMNPTFYPPPHHLSSSSIPSFSTLSQFPTGQTSFQPTPYPSMAHHPSMYPSSFYPSLRSEPQIYHVRCYPSMNPFREHLPLLTFAALDGKGEKSIDFSDKGSFNLWSGSVPDFVEDKISAQVSEISNHFFMEGAKLNNDVSYSDLQPSTLCIPSVSSNNCQDNDKTKCDVNENYVDCDDDNDNNCGFSDDENVTDDDDVSSLKKAIQNKAAYSKKQATTEQKLIQSFDSTLPHKSMDCSDMKGKDSKLFVSEKSVTHLGNEKSFQADEDYIDSDLQEILGSFCMEDQNVSELASFFSSRSDFIDDHFCSELLQDEVVSVASLIDDNVDDKKEAVDKGKASEEIQDEEKRSEKENSQTLPHHTVNTIHSISSSSSSSSPSFDSLPSAMPLPFSSSFSNTSTSVHAPPPPTFSHFPSSSSPSIFHSPSHQSLTLNANRNALSSELKNLPTRSSSKQQLSHTYSSTEATSAPTGVIITAHALDKSKTSTETGDTVTPACPASATYSRENGWKRKCKGGNTGKVKRRKFV